MTITLSVREIEEFATDLEKWYQEMYLFVMKTMLSKDHYNLMFAINPKADIEREILEVIKRFEKDNPKPDWRTFL